MQIWHTYTTYIHFRMNDLQSEYNIMEIYDLNDLIRPYRYKVINSEHVSTLTASSTFKTSVKAPYTQQITKKIRFNTVNVFHFLCIYFRSKF